VIVSPSQNPIEPALGWGALIAGATAIVQATVRAAIERNSRPRKLSDAILGGGLILLGVEMVASTLPDEVRLPLVVGSIAAMATSLAVRRLAQRVARRPES
jgi:Na+/phosphate symporter